MPGIGDECIFVGVIRRVEGEEKRVWSRATDDSHLADVAFESALRGFQLENHSAGDDAALDQALALFAGDGGENFFAVENAGNVGEIDQLVGVEKFGAGSSHVVGVDVVKLIVGSEAEAGGDRNQAFAPKRLNESNIHAGEISNEAEAASHFSNRHRLSEKTLCVGGGNTDRGITFSGDRADKTLVQQPGENHDGGVPRFAVGDAKTGDKFAFDAHALEGFGESTAATVDNENFVSFVGEGGDLLRECAHGRFIFEQSTCELDYGFH